MDLIKRTRDRWKAISGMTDAELTEAYVAALAARGDSYINTQTSVAAFIRIPERQQREYFLISAEQIVWRRAERAEARKKGRRV